MQHQHFFSLTTNNLNVLTESYNVLLVLLSYVVAALAGFCASSISQYVSIRPTSSSANALKFFGGLILGLGIWSMHFVGMLALSLPINVKYDLFITIISIVPAIIGSTITLFFIHKKYLGRYKVALLTLVLALGIAFMHFIGMAAMNMHAHMIHNAITFVLSILLSWLLAVATVMVLRNDFKFISQLNNPIYKTLIASTFFGFSVATMHYLAMQSAYFVGHDSGTELVGISIDFVAIAVLVCIIALVSATAVILAFKRKIYVLDSLANTRQTYMAETIDNMTDPFILADVSGKVLLINHSFYSNFKAVGLKLDCDLYSHEIIRKLVDKVVVFKGDSEESAFFVNVNNRQPYKFNARDGKWWLFRQTETYSNNQILTWTNITRETEQHDELLKSKDSALNTLQELQKTQDELAETKKLASITKLVANVAHELNTPLGVAITSLSGVQSKVKELEKLVTSGKLSKSALYTSLATIVDYEDLASRNVNRAANIIQQFKYISIDEYSEDIKRVHLKGLFAQLESILNNRAESKNIKLNIESDQTILLNTYEDALQQVINSLFDNAITHAFTDHELGEISIAATVTNNKVNISIKDNGQGIEDSVSDQIFEPFITTKRFEGYLGLGLYIAYNIVINKLKGKIELARNSNTGCEFIIELPVAIIEESSDETSIHLS